MTREEIKNTPELVDFMLDNCVLADSRVKVRKRLEEICDMAIKALEQEPCEDAISRQAVKEWLTRWEGYIDNDTIARMQYRVIDIPSVNPTSNVSIHITEREKYGRFN